MVSPNLRLLSVLGRIPSLSRRVPAPDKQPQTIPRAYLGDPMRITVCPLHLLYPPARALKTPIALSVVTSVSGLNKEIRRLTECICLNNQERKLRCPCQNGIPPKRRLRTEDLVDNDPISQETKPSQHHDPTYAPTLDGKFSMDHMLFRSKKSKRAPRNQRTIRAKTQPKKNPNLVDLTGERGRRSRHPRRPRSKSPGPSNCLQKHYNYLDPVGSDGVVHESALVCMLAENIPKAFNLAFVPTRSMDLAGVELAVATYIFSKDLPKSEILADVGHCFADRTALLTLASNERVMDDVITIVATMLSKTSSQHQWFIPTMIMQDALQGTRMTQANIDAVVTKHMRCKVDKVTEIFQPMWTDGHWYLMVVDVRCQRLMYFDSLKCTTETEARKLAMTQVALHLESITIGPKWLSKRIAERPRFSSYPFEEPVMPQQHHLSMDCGVWVLQWMIRGALWAIHSVTAVNNQTKDANSR
ncbi:hypothetical protein HN873_033523 [Arachis hypogaea]